MGESICCEQKYPTAHSSKLVCAIRQGNLSLRYGWLDVARRIIGCWPADHLDVLDHALHAEQCACRSC